MIRTTPYCVHTTFANGQLAKRPCASLPAAWEEVENDMDAESTYDIRLLHTPTDGPAHTAWHFRRIDGTWHTLTHNGCKGRHSSPAPGFLYQGGTK